MKPVQIRILWSVILLLALSTVTVAQSMRQYKDGNVWSVTFVKLKANMGEDYLNGLKNTWGAVSAEGVKQGLLVSYKILQGFASSPDDWDVMLIQEYKNLGAMEGNEDKWDAIEKKIVGGEDAMKTLNQNRVNMREIYGHKILREVVYQ
ncbi:MAG TPA: hypothetical protein VMC08_08065 [Bacteroidales bacterium]|nr:hypothetical protein [Bacteroidales bacterium]